MRKVPPFLKSSHAWLWSHIISKNNQGSRQESNPQHPTLAAPSNVPYTAGNFGEHLIWHLAIWILTATGVRALSSIGNQVFNLAFYHESSN